MIFAMDSALASQDHEDSWVISIGKWFDALVHSPNAYSESLFQAQFVC